MYVIETVFISKETIDYSLKAMLEMKGKFCSKSNVFI